MYYIFDVAKKSCLRLLTCQEQTSQMCIRATCRHRQHATIRQPAGITSVHKQHAAHASVLADIRAASNVQAGSCAVCQAMGAIKQARIPK